MTGRTELSALPDALRRLAAALDEVLALAPLLPPAAAGPAPRTDTRTDPGPYGTAGRTGTPGPARPCASCRQPLPAGKRFDAAYCSSRCRTAAHRARQLTTPEADTQAPDGETLVALLWPTPATGVTLMRDVERRPRASGSTAYRGRVRWIDPATGQYRGHTRTFDTPAEAWAWVRTYTAPASGEMHPPRGAGCISAAQLREAGA